jgi:hypothetical protein
MLWALPVWTLFVWATRIRIILGQDGSKTAVIVPVVLTVLAVAALVDRRRWSPALVLATVAVWAVRLPLVLVHHHSVPFKLVHAALAVVSLVLSLATWRALRPSTSESPTRRSSAPS